MDEQAKQRSTTRIQESPCPICGSTSFTWGNTIGYGPNHPVYFRPNGASWGGGREVFGRECNRCGNVQLFTKWLKE